MKTYSSFQADSTPFQAFWLFLRCHISNEELKNAELNRLGYYWPTFLTRTSCKFDPYFKIKEVQWHMPLQQCPNRQCAPIALRSPWTGVTFVFYCKLISWESKLSICIISTILTWTYVTLSYIFLFVFTKASSDVKIHRVP